MKTRLTIIMTILMVIFCWIQAGYACTFPPTAILTVEPDETALGVTVTFDASDSFAQSGKTIVKYEWDFDGDGTYDYYETTPCDGIATHTYTSGGEITAKLRVTDNLDIKGMDTYTLFVTGVHNITQSAWFNGIQSALNDANNADEIEVLEGVWNGAIDFGGVNCVLRSSEPNNWQVVENTIIDAGDPNLNAVTFNSGESGNCLLDGFTIKGGSAGVYCDNSSSPVIKHCLITRNNSYGVRCVSGSPVITNNKIAGNHNAVGVSASSATPPTIKNSLVCKNLKGISLASANSSAMVRNNTIADNNSVGIEVVSGTEPNVSNCIVWNNTSDMNGCSATYSCISDVNDANGVGNFTSDPKLWGVDSNNYYLTSESPCVTSGDPNQSYTGEIDLYGRDVNTVAPQQGAASIHKWYVKWNATGLNNGTSWNNAFTTLQRAISTTTNPGLTDGDEIWVAGSPAGITYKPGTSRNSAFGITKAITLYGGFAGTETLLSQRDFKTNETILSGDIGTTGVDSDNCYHVVTCNISGLEINGFTITEGKADGAGGNSNGGGVYNMNFSMKIMNCVIIGNEAWAGTDLGRGGGIYNGDGDGSTVIDCVFNDNVGRYGGGIYNSGSSTSVVNSVFAGNYGDLGGGMCNLYDSSTVINCCTFTNNRSWLSGGLRNLNSPLVVTNCIFWDNISTQGLGDEIANFNSNATFSYCNIKGWGGSENWQPYAHGTDGGGNIDDNPEFANSDDPNGGDNIWGTVDDGWALRKISPCRNTGNSSGVDTSIPDVAGNKRVYGQIDMGAYEWAPYLVAASDYPNSNVHKYNLGNNSLVWSALTTNWHASQVVINDVGDIYVADVAFIDEKYKWGTISKLNSADGSPDTEWVPPNGIYTLPEYEDRCASLGINSSGELALGIVATSGTEDHSVIKLTPAGQVQWNIILSSAGSSWGAVPLEDGNVIAIADTDFSNRPTLFKLNANTGVISWQNFNGNGGDCRRCLAVADDGSIYVGGSSSSANLWKRNSTGGHVWARTAGDGVMIHDICIIPDVGVVAVGYRNEDLEESVWLYEFDGDLIESADTGEDATTVCTDGTYIYVGGGKVGSYSIWRFDAEDLGNKTGLLDSGQKVVWDIALWEP